MQSGCQQHEPTEASQQNIANRCRNSLPLGREGCQSMSEGYIGELSRLLTQAAVTAIQQKTECINEPILQSINWISPSQRKRQLDKLL